MRFYATFHPEAEIGKCAYECEYDHKYKLKIAYIQYLNKLPHPYYLTTEEWKEWIFLFRNNKVYIHLIFTTKILAMTYKYVLNKFYSYILAMMYMMFITYLYHIHYILLFPNIFWKQNNIFYCCMNYFYIVWIVNKIL